jgi:hypothetical protein
MILIQITKVGSVIIVYVHLFLYNVSAYNYHHHLLHRFGTQCRAGSSLDVLRYHHHHRFRPSLLKSSSNNNYNNDNGNQMEEDGSSLKTTIDTSQIWSSRRKISKVALSPFVGYALDRAMEKQRKEEKEEEERKIEQLNGYMTMKKKDGDNDDGGDSSNQGLVFSAFIIAGTAVALRLGGRGAFVQLLGLDFIADSDIKGQIDTFIQYFQSLDGLRYLYFFFAWLVVKALCIDALTIGTYTPLTTSTTTITIIHSFMPCYDTMLPHHLHTIDYHLHTIDYHPHTIDYHLNIIDTIGLAASSGLLFNGLLQGKLSPSPNRHHQPFVIIIITHYTRHRRQRSMLFLVISLHIRCL